MEGPEEGGEEERKLFCLEVVVDKCSERGTEALYGKYKPKSKGAVDVRGVKDMEDLKRRLKAYLKEAQRDQFELPRESEYASRACAVRFLDYPLLIIDRGKVKASPTVSSHPLRGVEVGIPFGQGKSCMFHTSSRKLVRLLRDNPLHFVYFDLRRKAEPKLVGTASLPLSDSLVIEQKGLHTHAPIYTITGESLGVLSVYLRLSCHGSTLLRHLVNFKGISSSPEKEAAPRDRDNKENEEEEERGSGGKRSAAFSIAPTEAKAPEERAQRAERARTRAVADLSSVSSYEANQRAIYGSFKPPNLFYDPELAQEERPSITIRPKPSRESARRSRTSTSEDEVAPNAGPDQPSEVSSKIPLAFGSKPRPKVGPSEAPTPKVEVAPGGLDNGAGGEEKGIQANIALDTHEIIRELALEISNAIKTGAGSLLSQVGIRKEDSFVSTEAADARDMPELELDVGMAQAGAKDGEAVSLLTTNNVEDELEQLLKDLEQKPISSTMYGEEGATLREEVEREVTTQEEGGHDAPAPAMASTASDKAEGKEEAPALPQEEKAEASPQDKGGGGEGEVNRPSPAQQQQQLLILSDPSEEQVKPGDPNDSSTEESYTPFAEEDEGEESDTELVIESTYLAIKQGEARAPQPPAPPQPRAPHSDPPSAFDDSVHKTMSENPAMAAAASWESEYGDVPTSLDDILDEASLDLGSSGSGSGTENESLGADEDISEEILTEEDEAKTEEGRNPEPVMGGEGIKRVLTLFKTTK